jgi:SAM-dependent MidA family methyltransferase
MTGWDGPWNLIELGPGSGALMVDILNVLHKLKSDNKCSVHLIEKSNQLIKQQRQIFEQQLLNKTIDLNWYDSIDDIPEGVYYIY